MYCKNCGMEISSEVRYCPNCGTPTKEPTAQEVQNVHQGPSGFQAFLDNPDATNAAGVVLGTALGLASSFTGVALGAIFYWIWKGSHPCAAAASKKCAIISAGILLVGICFGLDVLRLILLRLLWPHL